MKPKLAIALAALTEFNPALIICFNPETHPTLVDYVVLETRQFFSRQYEDLLSAYLFVQDEILPSIRVERLKSYQGAQLLKWLQKIHVRLGNTVVTANQATPGEFIQESTVHWNFGLESCTTFENYGLGLITEKQARNELHRRRTT